MNYLGQPSKKIFIQVKDFKTHGFVTSSTENGYSNFETVKISEESNLHTLSVSDSVKKNFSKQVNISFCAKKNLFGLYSFNFLSSLKDMHILDGRQPYLFLGDLYNLLCCTCRYLPHAHLVVNFFFQHHREID